MKKLYKILKNRNFIAGNLETEYNKNSEPVVGKAEDRAMNRWIYDGGAAMIKGFKMKLFPGMEAEYERRHNLLWPEMKEMIHEHGGKNYTIFLDKETLTLFGYIEIVDEALWAKGADTAINRKWWDYMADIMETNPDNSPVSVDLKTVFHLD